MLDYTLLAIIGAVITFGLAPRIASTAGLAYSTAGLLVANAGLLLIGYAVIHILTFALTGR